MKEFVKPRQPEPAKASLFSQGLVDLMTKFEARERPQIAKGGTAAVTQSPNAQR